MINKIHLAPYVGADLAVMERDAKAMREGRPFIFTDLRDDVGIDKVVEWLMHNVLFKEPLRA